MVTALRRYQLPIYIVDDGSDADTQQQLAKLVDQESLVRLSRLEQNEGKGGAVMQGLRAAQRDGFTHALQIDADGQHDTADIPAFLAAAEVDSTAIICGQPIYDETVPKLRLYGRYLNHVWVWMETLSFQIKGSMCGFRLYPLRSTMKIIDKGRLPKRMDFDIAIIVRLVWAGISLTNIATRVTYPRDGISHFDVWYDNLRIVCAHAQLVFGMLWRLPILLWRKVFPPTTGSIRY